MLRLTFAVSALFVLAACAAPAPSASPRPTVSPTPAVPSPSAPPTQAPSPTGSPISHGPEGLVNDLRALGIEVEEGGEFAAEPLSTLGRTICVSGEPVSVYIFGTPQEAAAVAARIDPDDPANLGTMIIEWAGTPRFWIRDRILVLYLGADESVENGLVAVLGEPFARGEGGPPPLRGDEC